MAAGEDFDHQAVAGVWGTAKAHQGLAGEPTEERGREDGEDDVVNIHPGA
jgi:hypothetical protein